MTMTGIRADANETVATGHIMRCLTIAGQLKQRGERVLFFLADEYACPMLQQAGMEYVCLHTAWDHMEDELPALIKELERTGCQRLLVDSYQATPAYLAALRERLPVIYIDDLFREVYPVDLLINYNGYHTGFPYKEAYPAAGREAYPVTDKEAYPAAGREAYLAADKEAYPAADREAYPAADKEAYPAADKELHPTGDGKPCAGKGSRHRSTRLLLGPAYVPLRKEFSLHASCGSCVKGDREGKEGTGAGGEDARRQEGKRHVLVSCGGGDIYNALTVILEDAVNRDRLRDVVFHTVAGRFNPHVQTLEQMAREYPHIRLYRNVRNMAELMSRCDVAVSAAGTVLYELCAMRVPTVFFVCADNQEYDSDYFAGKEGLLFAGDIRRDRTGCVSAIGRGLQKLLSAGEAEGKRMRESLGRITDGNGADRIAQEILKL